MLRFDEETMRILDTCYVGADITRRRQANFDALLPKAGETILDIGCGNGLLTAELARAVGKDGQVIGIDPSDDMRKAATARLDGLANVDIRSGTSDDTGLPDESVDKAVSVQVFEYLDDLPAAARECYRILRPGGRLVVGDMHYDAFVWHSDDPDRMALMRRAWDHHFTEGRVPAILPDVLRKAGFIVEEIIPNTFCDHTLKPDGLALMMLRLMERFAADNGHVSPKICRAWAEEQEQLARDGRFFFSMTHFVLRARKP